MDVIKAIEYEQLKNAIPEIKVGNTVRVHVRIKEGNLYLFNCQRLLGSFIKVTSTIEFFISFFIFSSKLLLLMLPNILSTIFWLGFSFISFIDLGKKLNACHQHSDKF